ncbi:MAG: Hsp20/alpha crystallin family protein [Bacteroidales bacterium]|nr:Hsp20/alpha crystallin family protein [Bacteroidales bacterium]MEE1081980.1 Hsp20/alpha crystallin family protein [Bacteroidales bacterium]
MNSNSWFPTLFDEFFNNDWMPKMKATAPAVNVKEDVKAYTMEVAAPGIKKEFCRINIDADGNLALAIENKLEHKEENKEDKKEHYLRREFCYSNYQQTFTLPDDVDKEKIAAKVEDGVLTITLPKVSKEEIKQAQRQIEIG